MLGRGHFKIHKWATNSPELLKKIPKEARAPTTTDEKECSLFLSEETSSLGIRWDPSQDTFIFRHYCNMAIHKDDTKTAVTSLLARLFDPLGLISPFILLEENLEGYLSGEDKLEKFTFPKFASGMAPMA